MSETFYIKIDEDLASGGYVDEVEVVVDIGVYTQQSGNMDILAATCPEDFHGFEEVEYEILSITYVDEDGEARDLPRELTSSEHEELYSEVLAMAREIEVDSYDYDGDAELEEMRDREWE